MMYVYVTCRLDIGYTVTMMLKFSTMPSALLYSYLKNVAKYICLAKDYQGIKYKHIAICPELEDAKYKPCITLDEKLPEFSVDITQPTLLAFVGAAYTIDRKKQRTHTGFVFTYRTWI